MILRLNETITDDTLEKVIKFTNSITQGNGVIYLCSQGGEYDPTIAIQDIILNYSGITLIGYGYLYSCAFELFFNTPCNRRLLPGTLSMYHQAKVSIEHNEKNKPADGEAVMMKRYSSDYLAKVTIDVCNKVGLSNKEIALIKKGGDAYFDHNRTAELFNNVLTNERELQDKLTQEMIENFKP